MSNQIYGYCRVSTSSQNIERQVRNIKTAYPDAVLYKEVFTGVKVDGRREFNRLIKKASSGDTIVFDSVSRLSQNAEEGFALYEDLYRKGIALIFLKEPHINTSTYQEALNVQVQQTGTLADIILQAVKQYLMQLAKEQIKLAFAQAQREVDDLRERTREGIQTAKFNGKQIGQQRGRKLHVKKADKAKKIILQYSKDFGGPLNNTEVIRFAGISPKTYYKYKKELKDDEQFSDNA